MDDHDILFERAAAAELYHLGEARGINPLRWDRIREQDFLQVAEEISGQRCLRNSFIHCPFHGSDRTPSFKIYDHDAFCFACDEFFDAVSMVAKYRDCSRTKALFWLEDFFHLPRMDDVAIEPEDNEREITFEEAKPEYIRFAAKSIQAHPNLTLVREYLQYYFQGKGESSAHPLASVLGPDLVAKIARDNGLE